MVFSFTYSGKKKKEKRKEEEKEEEEGLNQPWFKHIFQRQCIKIKQLIYFTKSRVVTSVYATKFTSIWMSDSSLDFSRILSDSEKFDVN